MQTTKLQAVNRLLRMIQVAPVSGLEGLSGQDAEAEDALDYATNEVCLEQHPFCTDQLELVPDQDGEVKIGNDVLNVAVLQGGDRERWTVRNGRLFDRLKGKGYQVDCDKLTVLITRRIELEEMQEHQRQLVVATAARTWVRDKTGDPVAIQAAETEWALARQRFESAEAAGNPVNLLESNNNWQRGLAGRSRGMGW